ncbi:MAG TPA: hypothetical protein DEA50_13110, partial [Parvularcula sp.]|nr:hypothetical protein [Parvularcula sp.]
LGVSPSGFSAWLNRPQSARTRSDVILGKIVRDSFERSDRTYGARRVWHDVLAEGFSCGLHRVERLMRAHVFRARRDGGACRTTLASAQSSLTTPSTARSRRRAPTGAGSRISLTSGRRRVGSMSPSSSIPSPGGLSAGR